MLATALAFAGAGLGPDARAGEMTRAARAVLGEESGMGTSGNCCDHCAQTTLLSEQMTGVRVDLGRALAVLERLEKSTVSRAEFGPVKAVAFGFVGLVLVGFVAALSSGVFK